MILLVVLWLTRLTFIILDYYLILCFVVSKNNYKNVFTLDSIVSMINNDYNEPV